MKKNVSSLLECHHTSRLKILGLTLILLVVFNSTNIFNQSVYGQNSDDDPLMEEILKLADRIESLETEVEVSKAFSFFRRNLIEPGSMMSDEIIEKIYDQWVITLSDQLQNVAQNSKTAIENTLATIIDQKIKRLYWYEDGWEIIEDHKYKLYLMTKISIIDVPVPGVGAIKIADVTINVSGAVDMNVPSISNVVVESVQVFETELQTKGGIPGFPTESIFLGILLVSFIFYLSQKTK